jgi:glucose/arabinose dehydrogenase
VGSSRRWSLLAAVLLMLLVPARAEALGLAPIGNFAQPIFATSDPQNPERLFVVERQGTIKVVRGGVASTFADLSSLVQCCEGERGLLSMALPQDFAQTGLFYVDYTGRDGPGNLHVAELHATGDSAALSSWRNVLTIPHAQASNHNGGQLQFGPDGYLYVSTGDGGSTPENGQNTNSLLGKILRIDPRQSGAQPYSVPSSNPFYGAPGADETWAYGLRNPWRFSFDRQRGDLLIGEVGQAAYEEVDYAPAPGLGRAANYGWAACEGLHAYPSGATPCGLAGRTDPVSEYAHAGGACSITGGYVVRDPTLGDLVGRYLYADYCVGQVRSLIPGLPFAAGDRSEGIAVANPVSFGEDSCGRVYVAAQAATVYRFTGNGALTCKVLRVTRHGNGEVSGPGISCPPDCVEVFPQPQSVTLQAKPRGRFHFTRWKQDCAGHHCVLNMSQDHNVLAIFGGVLRTHLRLTAADKTVPVGARASLRVRASPCGGRRHDRVFLLRGPRRVATKRLNRHCVARFHPRVGGRSRFRAKMKADRGHRAGRSRPLLVLARGQARTA